MPDRVDVEVIELELSRIRDKASDLFTSVHDAYCGFLNKPESNDIHLRELGKALNRYAWGTDDPPEGIW